jgi:hypothetical protein
MTLVHASPAPPTNPSHSLEHLTDSSHSLSCLSSPPPPSHAFAIPRIPSHVLPMPPTPPHVSLNRLRPLQPAAVTFIPFRCLSCHSLGCSVPTHRCARNAHGSIFERRAVDLHASKTKLYRWGHSVLTKKSGGVNCGRVATIHGHR